MAFVNFRLAAVIGCLLLLSGCWDIKTIQDINYTTAVGLDYDKGQYIVYAQLLDFTNVAKQEGGGKPAQQAPAFVGRGKGPTMGEAFDDLNRAAQQQMFWGHVSALVIGENILKRGLKSEDFDGMIRFREIRYSQWIYGTKLPIAEIFSTKSFFNLSSLSTILHQPEMNHDQSTTLRPMRFQAFIAQALEPGNTVLLPSLGVTNETWTKDTKPDALLYKDGGFAVYKEGPAVFLDMESIIGMRWIEPKTDRVILAISSEGKPVASLVCRKPDYSFQTEMDGDIPAFSITGKVNCRINELIKDEDIPTLTLLTQEGIKRDIEAAYKAGKQKGVDVLSLEHVLYRQDFRSWGRLTNNGKKPLANYSLKSVQFKINLINSGMYRDDTYETNY